MEAKLGERRGHSEECRSRMDKCMIDDGDEATKDRLARTHNRQNRFIAEQGEQILEAEKKEEEINLEDAL